MERLARLACGARVVGEWCGRHDASRLVAGRGRQSCRATADWCRFGTLGTCTRLPSLVHLRATSRATRSKQAARTVTVNRDRLSDPPSESRPGSGSSRLGVRGREGSNGECGARTSPHPGPPLSAGRAHRAEPRRRCGWLAGGDEVHLLGDRHRVVADALVVAGDQRELHRGVEAESSSRRPRRARARGGAARRSSSSSVSSMSASAAADDGSRSTKAFTATRSCSVTWRPMRSTRPGTGCASSRAGYRRQVVRATLTMRSAVRSSSWATRSVHAHEPQLGRRQGRQAEEPQALVLDRVAQRVDGVVVGDDPVGVLEIARGEGLGGGADRAAVISDAEAHERRGGRRRRGARTAARAVWVTTSDHDHARIMAARDHPLRRLFPRCSPSRHGDGKGASTVRFRTLRADEQLQSTFQEGHPHASVRSLARAGSCSPRLALPVTAARHRRDRQHAGPGEARLGDAQRTGATFPLRLLPSGHRRLQAGSRSRSRSTTAVGRLRHGSHGLRQRIDRLRRHRRRRTSDDRPAAAAPFFYFPTVVGADHGVVQPRGREGPQPLGRHDRQDLPACRSPPGTTPRSRPTTPRRSCRAPTITVAHRSRQLGDDRELHQLPDQGGAARRGRSARARPCAGRRHPGRERQHRRGQDRERHRRRDRLRRLLRRHGEST